MENITSVKNNQSKNQLYYGDIILIIASQNPNLHKKYFFIDYIGDENIELIEKTSFTKHLIGINVEEGILTDETIEQIKVIYRNPKKGYARQNNLLPGTYIEILFNTTIKKIITGRVVNLEEDMIEILILETGNSIFIDFAYRGLPPQYKIDYIKILDEKDLEGLDENKEKTRELNQEEKIEEGEEGKERELEEGEINEYNEQNVEENEFINIENVNYGNNIQANIQFNVQLNDSEYKYDLKEQKQDLLNDLLSSVSTKGRTKKVLDNLNKLTNRFEEIVSNYSEYDENGNLKKLYKEKDLPDYLNESYNEKFNQSLHFIIPCTQEIKKVYLLDNENEGEDEKEEIEDLGELIEKQYPHLNVSEFNMDLTSFHELLKNINSQETTSYYNLYLNQLNEYFKPYKIDKYEVSSLKQKQIYNVKDTNIPFIYMDYNNQILLTSPDNPSNPKIFSNTFTDYDKLMYYNHYLFMPLYFINQSMIYNNNNVLLSKSLYNDKYNILDKHLSIYKNEIANIEIDSSFKNSSDLYKKLDYKFDKPYIYFNKKDDYNDFYNILSPNTSDVLNLYKDKHFLSYKQLFNTLETFKIYQHNINLNFLNEIRGKISDSINYKKREYVANQRFFSKKVKPLFEEDYFFMSSLYENIGTEYDILPRMSQDYVLQEFIHFLNQIDNLDYSLTLLNQENRKYYNTLSQEEINNIVKQVKEGNYDFSNMSCEEGDERQKNIVKIYSRLEELQEDNYKTIYVDPSINNEFAKNLNYYRKIKSRNASNQVRKLLFRYFTDEKNNFTLASSDAIDKEINYLIQEQKPVMNGDYAVLDEGDERHYFKWDGDHWEKESGKDCLQEKKCITDKQENNESETCKSITKLKTTRDKEVLESVIEGIQNEKIIDRELLLRKIDKLQKEKGKTITFNFKNY